MQPFQLLLMQESECIRFLDGSLRSCHGLAANVRAEPWLASSISQPHDTQRVEINVYIKLYWRSLKNDTKIVQILIEYLILYPSCEWKHNGYNPQTFNIFKPTNMHVHFYLSFSQIILV